MLLQQQLIEASVGRIINSVMRRMMKTSVRLRYAISPTSLRYKNLANLMPK